MSKQENKQVNIESNTHYLLKVYCSQNKLKIGDFLNEMIIFNLLKSEKELGKIKEIVENKYQIKGNQ